MDLEIKAIDILFEKLRNVNIMDKELINIKLEFPGNTDPVNYNLPLSSRFFITECRTYFYNILK